MVLDILGLENLLFCLLVVLLSIFKWEHWIRSIDSINHLLIFTIFYNMMRLFFVCFYSRSWVWFQPAHLSEWNDMCLSLSCTAAQMSTRWPLISIFCVQDDCRVTSPLFFCLYCLNEAFICSVFFLPDATFFSDYILCNQSCMSLQAIIYFI